MERQRIVPIEKHNKIYSQNKISTSLPHLNPRRDKQGDLDFFIKTINQ